MKSEIKKYIMYLGQT